MLTGQVVVQVKATDGHKKHLSLSTQHTARSDEFGHHLQLRGQAVARRKGRGERRHASQRGANPGLGGDRALRELGVFVLQHVAAALRSQALQGRGHRR